MRRIVTGAVIALLVIISAAIGFYYYQRYRVILSDPFNAIPTNAALIIECQTGKAANEELQSTHFWENWGGDPDLLQMRSVLHFSDSVSGTHTAYKKAWSTQPLYLSLHLTGSAGAGWLAAMNIPLGFSYKEVAGQVSEYFADREFEEREYEDVIIYESGHTTSPVCFAISKGVFLLSESPVLLEDAIRQSRNGTPLRKVRIFNQVAGATNKSAIRLYINSIGARDLLSSNWNTEQNEVLELASRLGRWSGLQLRILKEEIRLEGVCGSVDPSDWITAFQNSQPQRFNMAAALPDRTAFLLWIGSDQLQTIRSRFRQDLNIYPAARLMESERDALIQACQRDLAAEFDGMTGSEAGLAITEPAGSDFTNNLLVLLRSMRPSETERMLEQWSKIRNSGIRKESYRGKTILTFPDHRWALLTLGNVSASWTQSALTFVNGYFVCAAQAASLKTLLDDLADGKRLDAKTGFTQHLRRLGNDQHLFVYASANRSQNLLPAFLNKYSKPTRATHLQDVFITARLRSDRLLQLQAALTTGGTPEREPAVVWSTQLDTTLHAGPFLLPGDENGRCYVGAQDKSGRLYLFNESGKLLWKVLVNDTLLGTLHTVDYYRQGSWQLLFNTKSRLFILDREGKRVANYPIRLPASATGSLSLINRPGHTDPGILIPCSNGTVYHYRLNGIPDPDWNSDRPAGNFSLPLQAATTSAANTLIALSDDGKFKQFDLRGKATTIIGGRSLGKFQLWHTSPTSEVIVQRNADGRLELLDFSGTLLPAPDSSYVTDFCLLTDSLNSQLLVIRNDSLFSYAGDGTRSFRGVSPVSGLRCSSGPASALFALFSNDAKKTWVYRGSGPASAGYPVNGIPGKEVDGFQLFHEDKMVLTDGETLLYLYTLE